MNHILTAAQMKQADQEEIQRGTPSQTLMERAARAATEILKRYYDTAHVLFLCGNGNNGGDGVAMARFLALENKTVSIFYTGAFLDGAPDTSRMSTECARQFSLLPENVTVTSALETLGVTAIVDAIFGIGLTRPIEGALADLVRAVNQSGIPVLAVDIPSGINADNGEIAGCAIRAAHTVTMAAYKPGLLLYPGTALCGELHLANIGIPTSQPLAHLLEKQDLAHLPPRSPRAHKGSFGRVLVIGGSVGMSGAAYFAAKAAYRAGAGLVEIFAPAENRVIYQTQLPEALLTLYHPEAFDKSLLLAALSRADAIAIGMGLGDTPLTEELLALTLEHAKVPILADADALNVTAHSPTLRTKMRTCTVPLILTPHPGEAGRLLNLPIPVIRNTLLPSAMQLAAEFSAIAVLKDARTVITDSTRTVLNAFGNNGMATGGSGDVLAGIIAAFLAAGSAPIDAAALGVLAHALAGDAAKQSCGAHGLMASDIIQGLTQVLD